MVSSKKNARAQILAKSAWLRLTSDLPSSDGTLPLMRGRVAVDSIRGIFLRYTSKNFTCSQIEDSSEWPLAFALGTYAKSIALLRH